MSSEDDKINLKDENAQTAENAEAENAQAKNAEAENVEAENAEAENVEDENENVDAPNVPDQQVLQQFEKVLPDPIKVPQPEITIPRSGASESYIRGYKKGFNDAYKKSYTASYTRGFNSFVATKEVFKVDTSVLKNPKEEKKKKKKEEEEEQQEEEEEEEEEENLNQRGGFKHDLIVEPTPEDTREHEDDEIVDVPVEEFI